MAEKNGFTLQEVMWLPEMMSNIIKNDIEKQKIPYKRGQPQT